MRESIIQTAINKVLIWLAKKFVTALYKRTHFWVFSWGLDENTDLYLMSEESYHGYHRFGVREEKYADTPQTEDDYFLELMDAVERGEMSDASANQAYYEYINKQAEESDTPQTEQKDVAFEFNGKLWTPKDADTPQTEERSE